MAFPIIILGILPGFVWLLFFMQEATRPEPKRLIVQVFIMGIVAAIAVAIIGGILKTEFLGNTEPYALPYLLVAAALEEAGKFFAILLVLRKRSDFNEPIDAMLYMIVGAMGFATLENVGYLSQGLNGPLATSAIDIASLRLVGSTLLHAISSGLLGYFWAISIREFNAWEPIAVGFLVAISLHTFFNYLVINYGNVMYLLGLLIIAGLFVLNDFEELKWKTI